MKKDSNDILREALPEAKSANIKMTRIHPSLVPVFEEHDARVEAGYNIFEWAKLARSEKALEVAHYRLRNSIEAHQAAAMTKRKH